MVNHGHPRFFWVQIIWNYCGISLTVLILRGTVVIRTCDQHRNLYIYTLNL